MNTIKGDLIHLALEGEFDLIAHGANCFCTFGAGIAKAIRENFPEAYLADLKTKKGDLNKLGSLSLAKSKDNRGNSIRIANLYTQYHWGRSSLLAQDSQDSRYLAIQKSLKALKRVLRPNQRLALPKIGSGLAGGDWKVISKIIKETIPEAIIVEYDKNTI